MKKYIVESSWLTSTSAEVFAESEADAVAKVEKQVKKFISLGSIDESNGEHIDGTCTPELDGHNYIKEVSNG